MTQSPASIIRCNAMQSMSCINNSRNDDLLFITTPFNSQLVNVVPFCPGGGTVFYVTSEDHRYLSNREERNEV